ncbi:MAG: hypothetical protein AUJ60_05595 [Nitrospirae bacterium CG1_02_44_142]|nr:MAG: hypothetical protein AUJ60_05595 [Nitrospirae bacterium CG1_02_44_142]
MFKKMCFLTALIFIFLTGVTYGAVVTEVEPNNAPEKANHFAVGDAVRGQINYGDGNDMFTTVLPQSGIATVNISGYPSDCRVQVNISGFHPTYPTASAGFVRSDRGSSLQFSFSAMGNKTGYISVSLSSTAGGVCSGSDWCAVRCSANGPFYLMPFTDRSMKKVPSTYDGKPVLPPIQYQFSVALQALPDQYEPNHDNHPAYDFISLDKRLQKGIIKTIPIGQEITAYLFNEHPLMMRGTKGYENSVYLGGENDTDIYHIYLNQPDTVKVTLKNFPQNANSRIIITDSSGSWDESKTGAAYFERKITKPGNVFIEISKGRENRPLIYSTTPYKLLVTTGAATVVTPQPYQPPVVTQPYQPPVTTTVSAQTAGWNTTAVDKGGKNGQQFTYNCSPNGSPATVWGTDVYTNDSSICTSAVHSGLISFQAGGAVTIEIRQGQSSYTGSFRNGVISKGYGSWGGSFVFVGQISTQPYQPPVTARPDSVTSQPPQYYQPPVTTEPPQQYQPPAGNYPQGDVFTPQGLEDFWKGNIFERK